jgi:ankyrin repeat protein
MKSFLLTLCCGIAVAQTEAPRDSLADLIQSGNRKAALEKLRAGADVNVAQPDGTRPIHWAVFRVDHELLQALIAKKAKADVTNEFGATPIAEAAKLADSTMVKMLLDAGSGPEGPNQDGQTALMLAIKTGELPVIEMLIKAGANVNVVEKFENQTPLMWAAAAQKNAPEMVKMLLARGADVKPRAHYSDWPAQLTSEPRAQYRPVGGLTALLYAARAGCLACVESLIGAGADVNLPTPEGVTPLMIAIDNEQYDVAKLLLDRGANPHLWDWWGRTALYIAVDRKSAAAGARPTGGRGGVPAARVSGVSAMMLINALLAADVDPNAALNMHRPSRGGNSGRFGDNLLSTGCTPLLRAAMANDMDTVRALLAKGASPNISAMGVTPFLIAAGIGAGGTRGSTSGAGNIAMMDLMIQHGADVNAQVTGTKTYTLRVSRTPATNEGMSALHVAAQGGKLDVVRYLLDKGANPELMDSNGKKPIDLSEGARASSGPAGRGAGGTGARGGPGGGGPAGGGMDPVSAAEIRTLLENAARR